jgi:Pvc16 N-terminal domain
VKTAIRVCSITLRELLRQALVVDSELDVFFDPTQGGVMVVSLDTPQELVNLNHEGVALWLYRVQRDEQTLNLPLRRVAVDRLQPPPLPLRLHYLVAPIVDHETRPQAPELEQHILGKVLQVFNDLGSLRGSSLLDDLAGQDLEIFMRLEPMTLKETTRVWDALELSYQLCISYEVSVIPITSGLAVHDVRPVDAALPEYGLASLTEATT